MRGSIYFPTRDEARLYLFEYIEVFYRGRHRPVSGTSPRPNTQPDSPHDHQNHVHETGAESREPLRGSRLLASCSLSRLWTGLVKTLDSVSGKCGRLYAPQD